MVKLDNFPVFSTKKTEKTKFCRKKSQNSQKSYLASQMSSHRLKLILKAKKNCKKNYVRSLTTTHTTVPLTLAYVAGHDYVYTITIYSTRRETMLNYRDVAIPSLPFGRGKESSFTLMVS
jgi:hypothetical protein